MTRGGPPPVWRLLSDPDRPGAHNMAVDSAILAAVAGGTAPPTLRLYGWSPACLSLGAHQPETVADLGFCAARGVDVVRRPTGGRAVLHHLELTYAVVAPLGQGPLPRPLQQAYATICAMLVTACRALGVAAELTGGEVNLRLPGPLTAVPCFKAPAAGEVVVGGRKLIGSAMRAQGDVILQHGSLLLAWDGALQAGSMGLANDSSLRPFVTTFSEQLGRPVLRDEVEAAVVAACPARLGVALEPGRLGRGEQRQVGATASAATVAGRAVAGLGSSGGL